MIGIIKMTRTQKISGAPSRKGRMLTKIPKRNAGGVLKSKRKRVHPRGKRLVAKHGDAVNRHCVSILDSKYNAILKLSARREWSAAVYLDKLIDGNAEIVNELNDFLRKP